MKIGIPKEIKNNENRVALTPNGVQVLVSAGHSVYVEDSAGLGSNFTNEEYENAGAILVDAEKAWSQELVIKVKEPLESEYQFFRKDLILFTYLHLAPVPELTDAIVNSGMTAIAYETMIKDGKLPLLTPMSEVAGRMAVQIGAQFLEKQAGGKGVLLGAVPGVPKGHVVVIGGGISGTNAAKMAYGLGADVTILDVQAKRLSELDDLFGGNGIQTLMSNSANIAEVVKDADLIIGAVLIPGRKAPVLVTEEMVASMEPGTVIVDIAIDQGGIFETTGKTMGTLDNPTFVKHDVVHYAVPNMPGAVPRTSTIALTNASLPYATEIANKGVIQAIKDNSTIWSGVNAYAGKLTNQGVAEDQSKSYTDLADLL